MIKEDAVKSGVLPSWCRYVNTFGGEVCIPYRTKREALEEDEIMIDERVPASGSGPGGPCVSIHRFHKRTATYTRKEFIAAAKNRDFWLKLAKQTDDKRSFVSFMTQFFRFWWFNKERKGTEGFVG